MRPSSHKIVEDTTWSVMATKYARHNLCYTCTVYMYIYIYIYNVCMCVCNVGGCTDAGDPLLYHD